MGIWWILNDKIIRFIYMLRLFICNNVCEYTISSRYENRFCQCLDKCFVVVFGCCGCCRMNMVCFEREREKKNCFHESRKQTINLCSVRVVKRCLLGFFFLFCLLRMLIPISIRINFYIYASESHFFFLGNQSKKF